MPAAGPDTNRMVLAVHVAARMAWTKDAVMSWAGWLLITLGWLAGIILIGWLVTVEPAERPVFKAENGKCYRMSGTVSRYGYLRQREVPCPVR